MTDYASCPNLLRMFFDMAARNGDSPFLLARRDGHWSGYSWAEAAQRVRDLAGGLVAAGITRGDRIALISENRPEWVIADFAIMAAGAITVPAYTTNTLADHRYILSNVQARAVIASTADLASRAIAAAQQASVHCNLIIAMEMPPLAQHPGLDVRSWDDVCAAGRAQPCDVDATAASLTRSDLACVIHTSGTGGLPRGVMLHHGAILANAAGAADVWQPLRDDAPETYLSFLPLSHAYEHTVCVGFMVSIGARIHFAESLDRLGPNMIEVRPTVMTAVPRLYETLHQRILTGLKRASFFKRSLFAAALDLGTRRYQGQTLGPLARLADQVLERLVRDKVRARFGGRLKAFVSGGAALNPEIGVFFHALGVRVLQGYGQTEAGPVISANRPFFERMETVGPPLAGVAVKLAADGEIMVQGEAVMRGYWNDAPGTAQQIREGWLYTGDVGTLDAAGRICITDRKKDFIKNSGGDMIAPTKVENTLLLEPEILQAMVVGDGKPYLCAVLVPHPENTIPGNEVSAFERALERVNAKLAPPERVRKFVVASQPFSTDNGQMTPTLKARRHVIRQIYGDQIEALYK